MRRNWKEENTVQQAVDFINDKLDVKIYNTDIDKSHRIGRYDKAKKKARPIIVKFAKYNVRDKMFHKNQKLKDTGKSIREKLVS